ncbi:MAG: GGDEF domain-containing protein [Gemmataceae bacterium]
MQDELITARERMRLLATRDALTGVWNRGAILDIFDRELERAERERHPLGVAMADVDHFKRVNDTHGHPVGDAVLQQVAARMATAMRPYDLTGRYGGEEFLILLPGCDRESTVKVCERVRRLIAEQPADHDGMRVAVTLSVGCAVSTDAHLATARQLLCAADDALYAAKRAGRNRVVAHSPSEPPKGHGGPQIY